jgi:hypothetical protein
MGLWQAPRACTDGSLGRPGGSLPRPGASGTEFSRQLLRPEATIGNRRRWERGPGALEAHLRLRPFGPGTGGAIHQLAPIAQAGSPPGKC